MFINISRRTHNKEAMLGNIKAMLVNIASVFGCFEVILQ